MSYILEFNIKFILILSFLSFFLIICLLISFGFQISFINKKNNIKLSDLNDYYANEEDKYNSLKNGQRFFNICIQGKLINEIPKSLNNNKDTLISVVIPVYNTGNKIKNTVRSAQNQNISNIEIILVNDFSDTETNKTIEELIKEDKRIKVINNKINMGTLYSRCIGTLHAKGK